MAEFETADALVAALEAHRAAAVEAFTPYEVEAVQQLLEPKRSPIGWIALAAGLAGGLGAFVLQWWINSVDYPLDIGGKPDFSWPAFIPITFEMAVLFAATATLIGALVLSGLPKLYHPVFDVPGFERASIDRFWLKLDDDALVDRLHDAGALQVVVV